MPNERLVCLVLILVLLYGCATITETQQKKIELGINLNSGIYTVPVRLPGAGKRNFTFDTGASYTVLDKHDISLIPGAKIEITGVKTIFPNGEYVLVNTGTIPSMDIGTCTVRNITVSIFEFPKKRDGVLGMNVLEKLSPWTFNNGRLEFTCPN